MSVLITICARGGSKGIPGKNVKPVNGLPLIAYSIKTAQLFQEETGADIALSTDSEEIKQVAAQYGLSTSYTRSAELATDTAGKIGVIKELLDYEENFRAKKYDFVLDLDVTSPLRTVDDLQAGLSLLKEHTDAVNLFSVNPSHRNPYFNMVELNNEGYAQLVKALPTQTFSRQAAPKVFDLNASFYFYKKSFFDLEYASAITDKSLIYEMQHICFDLDEKVDYEFLSFLLEQNKLPFQLW